MYHLTAGNGIARDDAVRMYADFLMDTDRFRLAADRVLNEWPVSCEHFLSNEGSNRIAWIGQASMAIETGIPSTYKSGFNLLDDDQKSIANEVAREALVKWLSSRSTEGGQVCLNFAD